jgi:hypothetical protein
VKTVTAQEYQARIGEIEAAFPDYESLDTEALLGELSRLVGCIEIRTHARFDGYPADYRGPERVLTYSIVWTSDVVGITLTANGAPDHHTIRQAALYSLKGALAWWPPSGVTP